MKAQHFVMVGISVLALAACTKQTSDNQAAASASAVVALTDEALDQAPIPVKEDYEEQARQTITEENLDAQLSQLEKQIQEDK
jgi:hypothetical protein